MGERLSKLEKFKQEQKQVNEEYESSNKNTLAPKLSDITSKFNKGRYELPIGERVYTIKKFGVRDTITISIALGNSFLVPIAEALNAKSSETGLGNMTNAVMLLLNGMEEGKLVDLIEDLLDNTTIEGKPVNIDEDFDDLSEALQVCLRVLEVNFESFLKHPALSGIVGWINTIKTIQQ
jgi:hypothetical protein